MVCKSSVKQRQYISHYQLDHMSPGHAPVVDVCMCRVSASQSCLSYEEEEDSGSGGCSVVTAEWGCRD